MANSATKKLVQANKKRLQLLKQVILATNVVFAVVRAGIFRSSFDKSSALVWAVFVTLYAGPYLFLASAGRPTYSNGALVDGGEDLSKPGVLEYAHDTVYVTALAQIGCIFTPYAVLLLSIIPLFLMFMLCSQCCGGSSGSDEAAETDMGSDLAGMSRKDRRRAEREAKNM